MVHTSWDDIFILYLVFPGLSKIFNSRVHFSDTWIFFQSCTLYFLFFGLRRFFLLSEDLEKFWEDENKTWYFLDIPCFDRTFSKKSLLLRKKKSDMDKNINLALKYGPLQYAFIEICELESWFLRKFDTSLEKSSQALRIF